jgi:hypothetical protein
MELYSKEIARELNISTSTGAAESIGIEVHVIIVATATWVAVI